MCCCRVMTAAPRGAWAQGFLGRRDARPARTRRSHDGGPPGPPVAQLSDSVVSSEVRNRNSADVNRRQVGAEGPVLSDQLLHHGGSGMSQQPWETWERGSDDSQRPVPRPITAAQARHATHEFFSGLIPAPSQERVENAVVVVSELVANAFRHAGGVTGLHLAADRDVVEIAVRDPCPALPRERPPDLDGCEGGFGWPLIRMLARTVTVRPSHNGGKVISAVLDR
ncbi:ATP-binding protein [Streptomyces sp. NPDC017964]|uniref:ATP-binding protein n=1 Tax=Streptomyces sp. NPDC017964 TaxID=3365022 RepID=UPI0037ACDC97